MKMQKERVSLLVNVVDSRKNSYGYDKVWGVVEPAWHDNCIENATISEKDDTSVKNACIDIGPTSVNELIVWANNMPFLATLYIYDKNPMSRE